jgi:hypothetical protein
MVDKYPHGLGAAHFDPATIRGAFRDTASNLERVRTEWQRGDEQALRWIAHGWSVIGDSYWHRLRQEAREPVDSIVEKLKSDLVPFVLPRCDPSLRDRLQSLLTGLRLEGEVPTEDGDMADRWKLSWHQLRLDDELDSVATILRARGDAIAIEAMPVGVQPAPSPTVLLRRIAGDVRVLASVTSFKRWEREVELGRMFVPAIESNAIDLLNQPEFTLWCRRHAAEPRDAKELWLFNIAQEVRKFLAGSSFLMFDSGQAERIASALEKAAETVPAGAARAVASPTATPAVGVTSKEDADPSVPSRALPLIPDSFLSETDLANTFGVNQTTLRKQLPAWRASHQNNDWIRTPNPRPRDPKYIYRVRSVLPLLKELGWNGEWPISERPTAGASKKGRKKPPKS